MGRKKGTRVKDSLRNLQTHSKDSDAILLISLRDSQKMMASWNQGEAGKEEDQADRTVISQELVKED